MRVEERRMANQTWRRMWIRLPPPAPDDDRVIRLFAFAEEVLAVCDTQSVE